MNLTSMIRTLFAAPKFRRTARFRRVPTALALEDRKLLSADASQYQTISQTMHFQPTSTNFNLAETIGGFNRSIGTLTAVDIINSGSLTSDAQVENLSQTPANITATFGGTLTASGPSVNLATPLSAVVQNFSAGSFDGSLDYAGTSGTDFGAKSTSGSQSTTLTAHSDLVPYLSNNWLTFTESGQANSNTSAGGASLASNFHTTGSATITVVYHYIPADVQAPDNGVLPPLNVASPAVPATPFDATPVNPAPSATLSAGANANTSALNTSTGASATATSNGLGVSSGASTSNGLGVSSGATTSLNQSVAATAATAARAQKGKAFQLATPHIKARRPVRGHAAVHHAPARRH